AVFPGPAPQGRRAVPRRRRGEPVRSENPARRLAERMTTEPRPGPVDEPVDHAAVSAWDGTLEDTRFAGLVFLIPLLAQLGLPEALRHNSALAAIDFPSRLLSRVADHCLRVPRDDAIRCWLPRLQGRVPRRLEYVGPAGWWAPGGRLTVERPARDSTRRVWTDRSGRIVYALWRGRRPADLAGAPIPGRASVERTVVSDGTRVLEGWVAQLQETLRRVAGLGLRALGRRPGRVAVTRTHVHVVLPLRSLDVRVRRAGLDVDPGWVPWMGRVFAVHYTAE